MADPSPTPPGAGPSATDLIGVPAGYDPTQTYHQASPGQGYLASGLSGMRAQTGVGGQFSEQQNQFNSNPNAPKYHNGYEWTPASHPETIPTLQAQLIEAGLLKASNVRPGVWDQTSANVYKTALALANLNGGTDTDAIQFLIDNQKLSAAGKGGAGVQGGTSVQLTDPAQMRADYQSAAEQLTGGDLPSSEADAFIHAQQVGEMQQASVNAIGGTYTAPLSAEAFIRQNQAADVEQYNGLQQGLEFMRILGVV